METVAHAAFPSRSAYGLWARRARGSLLSLGIVGALIADGGCAARHAVSPAEPPPSPARLSVHPRAITSGTRTVLAGLQPLDSLYGGDSLSGAYVYVPKQCVGTRRMPLVVLLHGTGMNGFSMINWDHRIFQTIADSDGFILLAVAARADSGWDNISDTLPKLPDQIKIEAALSQVLRHYAIDPAKIALLGASAGSTMALQLGIANGDVFSRVLLFSGFEPFLGEHEFDFLARHGMPEVFIGMNTREANSIRMPPFVPWLRKAGYSVTYVEDQGPHYFSERVHIGMHWLAKSWQ